MNASQTFIMFAMTVYKCETTLQRYEAGVMQIWKLFLRDGVLWFLPYSVSISASFGSTVRWPTYLLTGLKPRLARLF
jgi:hypothetical protein